MADYTYILNSLNKQTAKMISIPSDCDEKKIWQIIIKEFIALAKKRGYNPIYELITHIMTGHYKSRSLTSDDKILLRGLKKAVMNDPEMGKKFFKIRCVKKAADEFWKKKEEEDGGLCAKFHTGMCRALFKELVGIDYARYNGLCYYHYKKFLNAFLPNSKDWKESKLFNFKNIVKEIKARYNIVLDEEIDFEKVLHTATFLPIDWNDFVNIRSERQGFAYKIAYKLYGEGIKYQFAEWFIRYCEELERCESKPGYEYSHFFSYDGLINSWLYDAVFEMVTSGEILSLRNHERIKKAVFDVSMKGSKRYNLGNPEDVDWYLGWEFERVFFG